MGSKNSAENKENNQNKDLVKDKNNTSGFFIKDTYSSYKGVMESETHVNNKSGKFSKSRSRSSEDTLEANSDLDSIKVSCISTFLPPKCCFNQIRVYFNTIQITIRY